MIDEESLDIRVYYCVVFIFVKMILCYIKNDGYV